MQLPPKVCPDCGEEYVHSATTCPDCDVELRLEGEAAEGVAADTLAPSSELARLRVVPDAWAVALSEELRRVGIPHRVEPLPDMRAPGQGTMYGVFVRREDGPAALQIDSELALEQVPDAPDEIRVGEHDEDSCPACGDPIASDAEECPGCGLPFQPGE